jgi:hypothetical protein
METRSNLIDIKFNLILILVVTFHQRGMELLHHHDYVGRVLL